MGLDSIKDRSLKRRIRQHVIAAEHVFFAIVQPGFEKTAEAELRDLGADNITGITEGGIQLRGGLEDCYRLNLCSRTVSRFIMRLTEFRAENFRRLGKKVEEFPWELYLADGVKTGFSTSCSKSRLYHTEKIEEEVLAGIKRRMSIYEFKISDTEGSKEPDIQKIFIRFTDNRCTISLDTSGELLYKRGYKTSTSDAPIRETLAALILLEAGIKNYNILLDPMCGSGTFSIEAAGILKNIYPSLDRNFSFMYWPSFKMASFKYMKKKLASEISTNGVDEICVLASDKFEENIIKTGSNLEKTGYSKSVNVKKMDFFKDTIDIPAGKKSLIVINPPYGKRLKESNEKFFRKLGAVIMDNYPNSGFAIISPSLECEKVMGLSYDRKILFMNGGIKVGLIVKGG